MNDTKNELNKSRHAYDVASEQASSLSVEKIEMERQLNATLIQLNTIEMQLQETNSAYAKDTQNMQQELRATLSSQVIMQREMVAKLTTSEQERVALQQRTLQAEEETNRALGQLHRTEEHTKRNDARLQQAEQQTFELQRENTLVKQKAMNTNLNQNSSTKEIERLKMELNAVRTRAEQNHASGMALENDLRSEIKALHLKVQHDSEHSRSNINEIRNDCDRLKNTNDLMQMKYTTLEMERDELKESLAHFKMNGSNSTPVGDALLSSEQLVEMEQLKVLVTKLTAQKLEIEQEKDAHVSKLHSEMENLEVELEHVHALHEQKHEEVLRLKDTLEDTLEGSDDLAVVYVADE